MAPPPFGEEPRPSCSMHVHYIKSGLSRLLYCGDPFPLHEVQRERANRRESGGFVARTAGWQANNGRIARLCKRVVAVHATNMVVCSVIRPFSCILCNERDSALDRQSRPPLRGGLLHVEDQWDARQGCLPRRTDRKRAVPVEKRNRRIASNVCNIEEVRTRCCIRSFIFRNREAAS